MEKNNNFFQRNPLAPSLEFFHGPGTKTPVKNFRGEFKSLLRYENAGNFMHQRKRRSSAPLYIDVIKPAFRMIVGRFDKEIYKALNSET